MRIIGSSPGRSVLQRGRGVRFVIENPGPAVLRYLRSLPCSNLVIMVCKTGFFGFFG
jgi:hypothetical protein